MTFDGKHWRDIETHFEWRQRTLDEMLAILHDIKDIPTLVRAMDTWSEAQGALDRDALHYREKRLELFPGQNKEEI